MAREAPSDQDQSKRRRQAFVHSVVVDGEVFDLKQDDALGRLEAAFAAYFGEQADIWSLVEAFGSASSRLTLDSLSITGMEPDIVETCATFRHGDGHKRGTCSYHWRRLADGTMERTRDAVLEIEGSRARLSLQIHANMAKFARGLGIVRNFEVEARLVGRYAYRFLHGVAIDAQTRESVGRRLDRHAAAIGVPHDAAAFDRLRSPREIADFIILGKIPVPWMKVVDGIVERRDYDFTIDQVVDVARRPGLALLLDRLSYTMKLDVQDDVAYEHLLESVRIARQRGTQRRLRGLFGTAYQRLPQAVRNSLIVYRPYVFPRPRSTPKVPDLSELDVRPAAWRVTGFRCSDGVVLEPETPDPEGVQVRDYRAQEVDQVIAAIEDGVELVTVTGLSGSGKTELMSWRLEYLLTRKGHRVVSLDALKLVQADNVEALLRSIDDVVRPTVVLFDESLYIRGALRRTVLDFCHRFFKWPGQHVLLVGGGLQSPARQRQAIESECEELLERHRNAHVELRPKPVNRHQAYRFLGLGRLHWLDQSQRIELLAYVLERYPPYFIPLMPIRFHEHPQLESLGQAKSLVDSNVAPDEWTNMAGMLLERRSEAG